MPAGYDRGKPDVEFWLKNIREGTEWRNKLTHRNQWDQWRRWYRGDFGSGTVPINLFFKMLRTMVPRVYLRNPGVSILPRKHQMGQIDFWLMSRLMEQVDNALFDRMHVKDSVKASIQDAFMFSTGFMKLGYGGEFSPTPDLIESEEAPLNEKGQRVEYHSYILPNTPWLLRVPTGRVVLPKHTLDFPSARWWAHQERRHIDDVRADSRLTNAKSLEPGVLPMPGEDVGKSRDMIDLYEIRDKKTDKVFLVAATNTPNKVLFFEDDELAMGNKTNLFPIQFNKDDEHCWGVSDSTILHPHQIELNAIRRSIRKHRRISVLKWIQELGTLSPDEAAKLTSEDEVGALVTLVEGKSISQIKEQTAGDIPAGLIKDLELENQMVQEILGMGVNQFGEYAPGSSDRSATEANIVNQATQIRTDERRDLVADTLVEFTEHLNYILGRKWENSKELVSIIGPEGQEIWVQFMQSELETLEYDAKIDPDSAVPETREARRQHAIQGWGMFAQDPGIDPIKLRRHTLTEMYGPFGEDMLAQAAPQQPGLPSGAGASPQKPAEMGQVITELANRQKAGGKK